MTPRSSWKEPWQFKTLDDAKEFARISFRVVWAVISGHIFTYEIYPGGRCIGHPLWRAVGKPNTEAAKNEEKNFDGGVTPGPEADSRDQEKT
jgi:hypothetical protein